MPGINKNLTREELYELVWSAPSVQVAESLGISDVALAKRCKKQNVPKPPLGYWAKVAAGQSPTKKKLPPPPEEVILKVLSRPVRRGLSLPDPSETLHPLAEELRRVLDSAKKDSHGRVRAREKALPEVEISKALIERAVAVFHVVVTEAEQRGVPFRKSRSQYDPGYFERENDRLQFKIEEELVEQAGAISRKRSYHYSYNDRRSPSGVLTFSLQAGRRYQQSDLKKWSEKDGTSVEKILPQLLREIFHHYIEVRKQRIQEAIEREKQRIAHEQWRQEYEKKEAIRKEQEARRQHADTLEKTGLVRRENLLKAAEWWRLSQSLTGFVEECERRWLADGAGELSTEQLSWLKWAKENVLRLPPFGRGYPDPAEDGPFDPEVVPQGGPYPSCQELPVPPSMPDI